MDISNASRPVWPPWGAGRTVEARPGRPIGDSAAAIATDAARMQRFRRGRRQSL